jgi:hypothetical protein
MNKLPKATDEQIDQYLNAPILISDAASMLRRPVPKNERPYKVTIMKKNNEEVDGWYKEIQKIAVDGKVAAGRVWLSYCIYHEMRVMRELYPYLDKISRQTTEQIEWWADFFENNSLEQLYDRGAPLVKLGWDLLMREIQLWIIEEKMEKIYGADRTFTECEKLASVHRQLMEGKMTPPFIKWDEDQLLDIRDKVTTILSNPVEPKKA